MGLDIPDLDDREFEQLVEDARKRIPVHSEEWTDHNAHDPGITFLELLAWIAETDVYRLDQLTDAHVEKYLQLVGVSPDPPTPATVGFALDVPPKLDGRRVPAGEPLRGHVEPGTVEPFRTRRAVTLTTASVAAVVTQSDDGRTDNTTANDSVGMYFRAFGDDPSAGDALYVGFDTDPFANADRLDLTFDFHAANLPSRASHGDEPSTFEPSHRVIWEFYEPGAASAAPYERWYEADRWTEFGADGREVRDGTTQFYEGGTVSLPAPDGWLGDPGAILGVDRPLHWIRARLARREPEPVDRVCGASSRQPAPPRPHYEVPPQFDAVRTNVVAGEHCAPGSDERLERHDGARTTARPGQTFHFDDAPVQAATVTVGGTQWQEVPDFAGSGPDDEHYVLDRAAGTVQFGDGVQGTVPAADQPVVATDYVYGGGTDGNVPASTDWSFERAGLGDVGITARGAASGGTDAESLDAALARAKADQRTPYRAVTRSDYSYIATHTPGLRFGRAAVRPGPEGSVRVVVVPFSPPDVRPVPSDGFLAAVDRHLSRHALLTDDVTAVAPTYVGVAVEAEVEIADGSPREARRRAAETAIEEFLDPIRGFEGDGWPFGRPVHRSEVYEVLEATAGVETVRDVSVATTGTGNLEQDASALPYPERIAVRVADAPDTCRRGD